LSKEFTVFVTGAHGYIGRFVVKYLLDLGVSVSTVKYKNKIVDSRVKTYDCDIFADYENIFKKVGEPDVCLHLAWTDGFVHNANSHLDNLHLHFRFIRNMIDGGLKHLSVLGTMHEIGYYEGEVTKSTPTNPHSLYGIAKNSLRQAIEVYMSNKDITFQWLRAFYIYGDDINSKSILSKIIQAERAGQQLFPFTSGKNKYDFIKVEDLAEQIGLTVLQNNINGIINCCSGSPISLSEFVEEFLLEHNFNIKLQYGVYPERAYDSAAIWGNNNEIVQILNESKYLIK